MINKLIKYLAILANIGMIAFALFLFLGARGSDSIVGLFLLFPPIVTLIAFYSGPDLEERRLQNQVRKATLRKVLKGLAEFLEEKK